MNITIRLLGEFFIQINDTKFNRLNANRHQALVAYLAVHAPQPVQRSEVAFHLWTDSNEEQALTNLRKVLHQTKQNMPESRLILSDARTLQLNLTQDDRLDILDFKSALDVAEQGRHINNLDAEQTALETAGSLYHGDLLPNWYDEWLIPERERLHDLFVRAADRLVALLEARKHYRDAIKYAQQLLQADRLREETYRALMRLHALNEDRAAALNIYHVCASLFAKELGVEPDASTQELHKLLLKDIWSLPRLPFPATHISYPLIAREQEWKALMADWKEAAGGSLHMTVLSGEAGIGKTRLAEDLVEWAARQGIRTCSSACYPAEAQISYAPLIGWLRSAPLEVLEKHWKREIARLIPELQADVGMPVPMTETWQKQVFHEAIARALSSHQEPLLLLLDDLHWCDIDTLEWLHYFMRFDRKARVLVLTTLRAEELSFYVELQTLLLDLRAANQITEVELTRLSKEQTGALGAQLLEKNLSEREVDLIFNETEGVPLFAVELARTGLKAGSIQKSETTPGRQESLPARLRAILEARLMRLSTPARAVAESAAVIGREFNFSLLKKISELDESTTITALDELWRRRMVRERDGHYDFSHDKLREAALANIGPVRLRWLHQRTGEALEAYQSGAEYARIADHFERAGLPAKASGYYAFAAAHAQKLFAFSDALAYLKNAIILEAKHAMLANLHEKRGDVFTLIGNREDSFQAFNQALGLSSDHLQRARLARKQISLVSRYDIEVAHQKYGSALEEINLVNNDPGYWHEWIEIQFAWIQACYWQQDIDSQEKLLQETKEPVEQRGTPIHQITYYHHVINSEFARERYFLNDQHIKMARENVARAIELGNPYKISTAKQQYSMVVFGAERFDLGELAFRETIELSERNGDSNSLLIARVYLSLLHRRLKNMEDVRADTQALSALLEKVSQAPQYQAVVEANLAWLGYQEGKMNDARRHAQKAIEIWKSLASNYPAQWAALTILFALAVEERNTDDFFVYARDLLNPSLQRLRADVESALLVALETDPMDTKLALRRFRDAVERVKAAGYL